MQNDYSPLLRAALHSMNASRWTLLMFRMFGARVLGLDGNTVYLARRWRGKMYLIDHKRVPRNTRNQRARSDPLD